MDSFVFLSQNTVTAPPQAGETTTSVSQTPQGNVAGQPAGGMWPMFTLVIYIVFIFGAMWLLVFRPQKKREKKHAEMISNIGTGDSVVTNTGFYGKVVDVTEECFIIEFGTNKSIRIPVDKAEVAGIKNPNLTVKRYDTPIQAEDEQK